MTATEHAAFAELYDAHGAIAREAMHAVDALRVALGPVELDTLPALLREALRRCERVHGIAAAERERWA